MLQIPEVFITQGKNLDNINGKKITKMSLNTDKRLTQQFSESQTSEGYERKTN